MAEEESGNLAAELARLARVSGWWDQVALVDDEGPVTHGQVHEGAGRMASAMAEAGVGPGDRVLVALSDSRWFALTLLGVARLGAVAFLVNPRLAVGEHTWLAADCDPALVVCEPALAPRFPPPPNRLTSDELAGMVEGRDPAPVTPVDPAAPFYAQYTSGTTGRPKAALHRHHDPRCYYEAMRAALDLRPSDVLLSVSKAYFAYGLGNSMFFPLFSGASAVLVSGRPTPEVVTELVGRYRPTVVFGVPSFYARLVAAADPGPFRGVRVAVSAGETLSPALFERLGQWGGFPVLDGLGSTEVGQTFVSNTLSRCRPGTVGVPLRGYAVSVRGENGAELAAGEVGALWVAGPSIMAGYWRRPEETAAALVGDWLRTGDRASIDRDGFVHLAGRGDDLELVGGITVSPLEIEPLLASHPQVAEVAVASVADELGATRLRAYVVLAPGVKGSPALAKALIELVRAEVAPYKVPRTVTFVPRLPRTPTGKLQRFLLRSGWSPSADPVGGLAST